MTRPIRLAFACLACFLLLLPLTLEKPGLPLLLAGYEATYYSMAASLAADGDLRCERRDLERLFTEFPFAGVRLELARNGPDAPHFARPVIYPLLAAPFVALWGANGPLALNALLFLLALHCGWLGLRRVAQDGPALVFCLAFFVFSTAFAYLFRIEPQVLVMATVAAALALGWHGASDRRIGGRHRGWLSGAVLGVGLLQEPALAAIAVPLGYGLWRTRRRDAGLWLAGCAVATAVGVLASIALTGEAWPGHLGSGAASVAVDSPLDMAPLAGSHEESDAGEVPRPGRSALELLEDAGFMLWGRRTGNLPYFPLVIPILALFAAGRKSRQEWLLLAALAALAGLQLLLEPVSGALHGAQIGNPHMVGVYPAFLFLIPRLRRWLIVVSCAFGALILGSLLSLTLGVVVPGAGAHAHTRNLPFSLLPFEYPALGRASGLDHLELHGLDATGVATFRLWAPADQAEVHGDELWLLGGESVELWLEGSARISSAVFQLRNLASNNRITLRMAGEKHARDLGEMPVGGLSFRLEFEPEAADKVRRGETGDATHYYRLKLTTRVGEKPKWATGSGPDDYLGVAVAVLGSRELLDRELFTARWLSCGAPPRVTPGEEFLAAGRLRNDSAHRWPSRGPARVRLSYRWLDAGGRKLPHEGFRTELPGAVEPGDEVASWVRVKAPEAPGNYILELDPVFENVAWFSSQDPEAACRVEVQVGV